MSTGSNGLTVRPSRGDVWLYDPNPVRGREQGNVRPGIVISDDGFNDADRELVMIIPMTRRRRAIDLYPYHVEVRPEHSGLQHVSVAMCEQIRSISIDHLIDREPRGQVQSSVMSRIEVTLIHLLGL